MITCVSCEAQNPEGTYCLTCGAMLPVEAGTDNDDDVLSLMMGLVCPHCDAYNDAGGTRCVVCQRGLADAPATAPAAPAPVVSSPSAPAVVETPSWLQAPVGKPIVTAQAMPAVDLAVLSRGGPTPIAAPGAALPAPLPVPSPTPAAATSTAAADCPGCGEPVESTDRFCRSCGHALKSAVPAPTGARGPAGTMVMAAANPVPSNESRSTMMMPAIGGADLGGAKGPSATQMFGAVTVERSARLSLVRGHTMFGTQWRLQAQKTVIGRNAGMVLFPDDKFLADAHCALEFRGDALWLVPMPSENGVFVKLRGPLSLGAGDEVVVGAQRLRVLGPEHRARVKDIDDGQGTQLYASPHPAGPAITLERIFARRGVTEVYHRSQRVITLGRERCDLSFPDDGFMSTRHARITRTDSGLLLEDTGSRNGTFVRARGERQLMHGDLLLLGEQVLRVEVRIKMPGL